MDIHLPEHGHEPFVVISNHQSTLDIILIASLLRRCGRTDVRWIVKQSLRRAPIIGFVANEIACAFVTRTGTQRDALDVRASAQLAGADGASIVIFPEGTRFRGLRILDGFRNVLRPRPRGFQILREVLPHIPILSVTIRWHPPIGNGQGTSMFQAADFFGK